MITYEYKGFDSAGAVSRGLIEALDLKEAREKLATRGILAEKIDPAGRRRHLGGLRVLEQGFNLEARAALYREVGTLVRAGLPLAHALEVLIQAPELGENRSRLAGVRDRIRDGSSLARALADAGKEVTPFELAVIEVGERAGTLDEVLGRLAAFLEEQQRLQERVQTALVYPFIVFLIACCVGALMLGVMIPRIGSLLVETNIPLPLITRSMIFLGKWILPLGIPALVLLALAVYFERRRVAGDAEQQVLWDRQLFRLPLWGRGYTALVNLRFARTLTLLLSGGVSLVEGLGLAGRATGSPWVGRLAEQGSESLRHGKSLADVVRAIPPLSGSLPGWLQAGEASGKLEELLANAGDRFQQQWERLVSRSLSVLEPVLILVVGGFVLVVALSILLPVLSLNRTLM